jgi:TolA-binding protein
MSNVKESLLFVFIILAVGTTAFFVFFRLDNPGEQERKEAIQQINQLRIEIVKLDSIRRSEQRRQIDSMMQEIKVTQAQAEKLNSINQKLRQQNEKLDRIYNSVHADMPDF